MSRKMGTLQMHNYHVLMDKDAKGLCDSLGCENCYGELKPPLLMVCSGWRTPQSTHNFECPVGNQQLVLCCFGPSFAPSRLDLGRFPTYFGFWTPVELLDFYISFCLVYGDFLLWMSAIYLVPWKRWLL